MITPTGLARELFTPAEVIDHAAALLTSDPTLWDAATGQLTTAGADVIRRNLARVRDGDPAAYDFMAANGYPDLFCHRSA